MLARSVLSDEFTQRIIGFAIEVHRTLGPGLLESVYEGCLCSELEAAALPFARQMLLPVSYKGRALDGGYRIDLVVEKSVVVEIRSVEALLPVHQAQPLTYMKLSGIATGLLLNFRAAFLKDGIRRMTLARAAQS